jgi:hypothetical protein
MASCAFTSRSKTRSKRAAGTLSTTSVDVVCDESIGTLIWIWPAPVNRNVVAP